MQRNFKESREAWKDSARGAADSINKTNKETANTCFDISDRRRVADECTGVAPTLTGRMGTGGNNQPIVLENHPNDSRVDICDDGICPTLTGRMGTGGGNVPMVMEENNKPITLQIRSGCDGGGNGPLLQIDKSASLTTVQTQTLFEPIPIADKATRCKGGGDTRNDDGAGNGLGIGEPGAPAYTLTAADKHAVAYAIDRASFNQGENALYGISIEEEVAQTLVAKGPNAVAQPIKTACCWDGGQIVSTLTSSNADGSQRMPDKDHCNAIIEKTYQRVSGPLMASGYEKNGTQEAMNDMYVATEYIVRRLTPLECCRLQGFPDYWTHNLGIKEPTEDDILYWKSVFKEYTQAMGQKKKEKTDKQIAKWIKNPDSDSAKYKMWGNGIALPCAMFVMEGIVEVLQRESKQEEQE